MDPITQAIAVKGAAKLADAVLTAFEVGMEREAVLSFVAEREQAGRTPDQIADDLAEERKKSSVEARAK